MLQGIPVRDLVQATFKLFRDARIVDAIVFSLYFSLFLSILYLSFEVHLAFTTDDAMMDLFLDEEFEGAPYKVLLRLVRLVCCLCLQCTECVSVSVSVSVYCCGCVCVCDVGVGG